VAAELVGARAGAGLLVQRVSCATLWASYRCAAAAALSALGWACCCLAVYLS
jgi:hypothetical protein